MVSDGRIAYYGAPQNAYEYFTDALIDKCLYDGKIISEVYKNPAGKGIYVNLYVNSTPS